MASLPHGTSHSKHPSGPTCAVAVGQRVRWAEDSSSPTSCRKTSLSSPMTREKVQGEKMNLYYLAADDNKHCCLLRCYVLKQEHDVFPFYIIFVSDTSLHFFFTLTLHLIPVPCDFDLLVVSVSMFFLRPEQSFFSDWGGFLRAPSRRCPPWSQQDVWQPSSYPKP